jgi:hypothetical protein
MSQYPPPMLGERPGLSVRKHRTPSDPLQPRGPEGWRACLPRPLSRPRTAAAMHNSFFSLLTPPTRPPIATDESGKRLSSGRCHKQTSQQNSIVDWQKCALAQSTCILTTHRRPINGFKILEGPERINRKQNIAVPPILAFKRARTWSMIWRSVHLFTSGS